MSKLIEQVRDHVASEAALRAGRELSNRALDALTLSDDERASREAQREAQRRATRIRIGLYAIGGVAGVVVVLGVLARLWKLAMGLALCGALAAVAWLVLKPRVDALRASWRERDARRAAEAAEHAQRAAAEAAQRAAAQKIDDELAALKKRV